MRSGAMCAMNSVIWSFVTCVAGAVFGAVGAFGACAARGAAAAHNESPAMTSRVVRFMVGMAGSIPIRASVGSAFLRRTKAGTPNFVGLETKSRVAVAPLSARREMLEKKAERSPRLEPFPVSTEVRELVLLALEIEVEVGRR